MSLTYSSPSTQVSTGLQQLEKNESPYQGSFWPQERIPYISRRGRSKGKYFLSHRSTQHKSRSTLEESLPASSLTQLMGSGEGRRKPIVLYDRAASLGITHGAHISHAQGVTGGSSAEVLPREEMKNQTKVRDSNRRVLRKMKGILRVFAVASQTELSC